MAFSVDVVAQPSLSPSQPPHHPTCLSPLSPCPTHTRTHMKSVSGQLTLPFRAHLAVHQPVCLGRGGREGGRGGRVRPSSGHCPTQSFGERGDGGIQVERATHSIHDSTLLFGTDTALGQHKFMCFLIYPKLYFVPSWSLDERRTTAHHACLSVSQPVT